MYKILAQALGIPVVVAVEKWNKLWNWRVCCPVSYNKLKTSDSCSFRRSSQLSHQSLTASELAWLRILPEQILVVIDEAYFEFSQTTTIGELLHPELGSAADIFKSFRLAAHLELYALAIPETIAA